MDKKKGHPKAAPKNTRQHNGNSASSQRTRLVEHLQDHGSITTIEARRDIDIMMPAARIFELRKLGCRIDTIWAYDTTEQGKQHCVARYVWKGKA